MKKILAIMLAVMMIAVMAIGCSKPAEAPAEEPTGDVAMQYISVEDAAAKIGDAAYLFLDVRKAADHEAAHIKGSVSADMDAAKNGDAEAGKATMTAATEGVDANIVIICYSGKAYAQATTNALAAIGYDMSKVFTLEGGMNAFSEAKADLVEAAAVAPAEEEAPVASGDCG